MYRVLSPIADPDIFVEIVIKIYGHSPSADLRMTVVSYLRKYVHKVLVKRLV